MFQTFISRHNSNFFSDKLVLTSVTPASSAPVLQTPKATSSTLYFDSLTVNAGNGGFLHCIQMDTSVNAANQVVSVGADIAFDKTLQVGYANHFYRSAHKFEQICRHRLRRQNVGYSNFSQPQSHLSFCVLLQYLVERRRVVTQLGKLD